MEKNVALYVTFICRKHNIRYIINIISVNCFGYVLLDVTYFYGLHVGKHFSSFALAFG